MFATYIRHRNTSLGLLQDPDNLLLGESLAFHWVLLVEETLTAKVVQL
jgi:hypothetical protein